MISEFLIITWVVASRILLQSEATPTIRPQNSEECDTPACQEAARYLLDSIDPSVDPCQDFYHYSCGGWFEKHPIPKDKTSASAFQALQDQVKVAVAEMLKNAVNEVTNPKPIYDAGNFFVGCLDEDAREAQGLNPLKNILDSFGGWPMGSSTWSVSEYQWQNKVAKLKRMLGVSSIFSLNFGSYSNTSQQIIHIYLAGFPVQEKYLVNMTESDRAQEVVTAYRNFIISMAKLFNPNVDEERVTNDADEIIQFESALAHFALLDEAGSDESEENGRMTIAQLQNQTEFALLDEAGSDESEENGRMTIAQLQNQTENTYFEWTDFLNEVLKDLPQVTDETEVFLHEKESIKNAIKLAHETNPRILANYIGVKIISKLGSYTTKAFRQKEFEFYKVISGVEEEKDMEETCMAMTLRYLQYAVERLYVDKYFPEEEKRNIEKMIEDVRSAYRVTIMDNTWMDTETRNKALEKLDAIAARVGYSPWIKSDTELSKYYSAFPRVEKDEFFSSVVQIIGVSMEIYLGRWNQPEDPNDEWPASTDVNAYFDYMENTMDFPAGILNPPFYGYDSSPALNFGGIGTVIGHEIGHAFDNDGILFDKDGKRVDWWSNDTKEEFNRRAECLRNQYSSIVEPMTNTSLNANQTLGDDISDNGAIRNSYFAFKFNELKAAENEWLQHKNLPGVTATPDQLFFLGFGTIFCGIARKEKMESRLKYDSHSPPEFRVLVSLRNSKEFAEAFNCPVGSPMNPASKCVLW